MISWQTPLERILTILAIAGVVFMIIAACITATDVVSRRVLNLSIPGLVDLTQLAMMYAVFMSIAYGYAQRVHVAVTLLTDRAPVRLQKLMAAFWWLLGAIILAILSYASFLQAQAIHSYGDVSQNIRVPMIAYWTPVVAGLALSVLGSLLAVIAEMTSSNRNTRMMDN